MQRPYSSTNARLRPLATRSMPGRPGFVRRRNAARRLLRLALGAGLLLLALAAPASAQEATVVGAVVKQKGPVTAFQKPAPRSLFLGALVYEGDKIITPTDAKVEIKFDDGSLLSVGPDTQVEVTQFAPRGRKPGALTLLLGIIRTNLASLWTAGFEVRSRAAIASVRSTDWVTEARGDGTSVFVVSGAVEVRGAAAGGRVLLARDQGTDVEAGGDPAPPTAWGSARVEDVRERTRVP